VDAAGEENPMKIAMFHKPMFRKLTFDNPIARMTVLAICTAALSATPGLMAQDNSAAPPPPQQQDSMGPQAGGHGRAGRRGGRRIEMLTRRLNLTPDQVTQIKAIDTATMSQMKALRSDTATANADKRSQMMAIHQASQDKIRNVLTDEQKTKFDAMQAKMKDHRHNRRGGQGAPPPPPPPEQ
jgi:Spy/CpxP family protein refolding chaperone